VTESIGGTPSAWLLDHLELLPADGRVLDVACGRGRHALYLARRGYRVHAVDREPDAIAGLRATAAQERLPLTCEVVDLETDPPPRLGTDWFDAVVVFRYLHRPLFPSLIEALAPGGCLIYETFTIAQALRGRPTNPRFLLKPGELVELAGPLAIVDAREGDIDGQAIASIVATRSRG
jgi:SAM-dependent methyltransferase